MCKHSRERDRGERRVWVLTVLLTVALLSQAGCTRGRIAIPVEADIEKPAEYILQAGDKIRLDVFREPDLSGPFQIDRSGIIRHPVFGEVDIGGLTVPEAESRIAGLLGSRYLVNPQVVLRVEASQASQIVILGEVKTPGVHPIRFDEPVTLLKAIATAGGFTELANLSRVQIVRNVDGQQQQIRVQVERIVTGQEADVILQPNDVVMVPQTFF